MLSFRTTSAAFLFLVAFFSALSIYTAIGLWLIALLAFTFISMLVFGSIVVCSGFYVKAVCKKATEERVIALTFDDGPNPGVTPKVLDLLKAHDIRASFFCIGKNVADNHELIVRIKEEGHLIGNHSYSHTSLFDFWGSKQMQGDVEKAEDMMALATGQRPEWFRPPFGVTNPTVAFIVKKKKYKVMGWSIRSLDTTIKSPEKVANRIKKRWHPGGIILLHDSHERVVEILREVIEHGKKEGYRFVRADELFEDKA